jgi:fluoroquinolone resistance protein
MDDGLKTITTEQFLSQLRDGADFNHIELHDADLAQTEVRDLVFRNCTFVNVDLSDGNWEGWRCLSSKFINCRFIDADLEKAVFENCSFFNPETSAGCTFLRANLRSALFNKCDISACVFEGADVLRITIQGSKAIGVKFFQAKFSGTAKLVKNNLRYADLRGAHLSKCDVSQNDLVWATLDEADFTQADLMGCDLGGATIRYTKFAGADLRGAVLNTFDIRTMDIGGAKIFESQMRRLLENCELIIFPDNH